MASREDWQGRTGLEWARRGDALERLLGPAASEGLAVLAPRPGERVLDLGCGAGASALALSDAVAPNGAVTAIDVSPDLLAVAKEALRTTSGVEVVEADAQTYPFPNASFDALYSRFGSMFFDDPAAAFVNIRTAMAPGARAVFVAWREPSRNQWASVPMTFSSDGASQTKTPKGPGPFAWADPEVFEPLLMGAGFKDVKYSALEYMAEIAEGDAEDPVRRAVDFMMRIGPLAARMKGANETAKLEAERFLASRLSRHVVDGAVRLLASAWIIQARV